MTGMKISIISDTHLLPERFVYNNETFRMHMQTDRKLLAESEGLLNAALELIDKRDSQVLFVTGDMTKDGEKASHQVFNDKIKKFLALKEGRRVFLIPGNHDINNLYAYNYNTEGKGIASPIKTVTPPEFVENYREIVYGKAFAMYKDSGHFQGYLEKVNQKYSREEKYASYAHGYASYASRIDLNPEKKGSEGLTIIGLDTIKYSIDTVMEEKDGCQNTDGIVTVEQLRWICDIVQEAKLRDDLVVLLSHHAFLPHFNNQEKSLAPYIIDNHADILEDDNPMINGKTPADVLADLGIKFIFTGHMHAQDIAKKISPNKNPIYDIETGSTVTYPLPIRHLTLTNDVNSKHPKVALKVETELISEFEYLGPEGKGNIRVTDALKHASQDMITADLIEGLFAEYVLPNNKYDARDIFEFAMNFKMDEVDFFDFICENYLRNIWKSDEKLILRNKKTYKLFLSLKEDYANSSMDNAFIFTIKSLGQTFSYKIKKIEFNSLINELLDQVDENVIQNYRLLLSWIKRLADAFLKVELTDKGSINTISDLANEAYLLHILGDEHPSQDLKNVIAKCSGENVIKTAFAVMKKDLQYAIDDLLSHVRYDGLIEKYLTRFTDNNRFFGGAVDRRIYKFFGSSIADLLKNLKLKPSKIYDLAMSYDRLDELTLNKSQELLDFAYNLSTEAQPDYKDFAYFEDNNTFIEEPLTPDKTTSRPIPRSNTASRALMYADIVSIGSLLIFYMSKRFMG